MPMHYPKLPRQFKKCTIRSEVAAASHKHDRYGLPELYLGEKPIVSSSRCMCRRYKSTRGTLEFGDMMVALAWTLWGTVGSEGDRQLSRFFFKGQAVLYMTSRAAQRTGYRRSAERHARHGTPRGVPRMEHYLDKVQRLVKSALKCECLWADMKTHATGRDTLCVLLNGHAVRTTVHTRV